MSAKKSKVVEVAEKQVKKKSVKHASSELSTLALKYAFARLARIKVLSKPEKEFVTY